MAIGVFSEKMIDFEFVIGFQMAHIGRTGLQTLVHPLYFDSSFIDKRDASAVGMLLGVVGAKTKLAMAVHVIDETLALVLKQREIEHISIKLPYGFQIICLVKMNDIFHAYHLQKD